MFVIVDKEKEDTDRCFGTDSVILTKSIDFIGKTYEHHTPDISLKFVYTGSLLIGRDKTLALLADAINQINSGGERVELYVYSQTEPSDDILRRINNGASHFCGRIGRDEVLKVQKEADVVVFAEALEGKDANVAKLSFSTKITDYLSSGKCILAIGREYIAPIDYFNRYDAAIIAHSENEIHEAVIKLINNPELVDSYGEKAFNTAKRNHERDLLNKRFVTTMLKAIE
jgi:glycosyltransferase involved in cell wall biosynthesis